MPRTPEQQREYMRDYRARKKAEQSNAQAVEQVKALKQAVEEVLPEVTNVDRPWSADDDVPMFPTDREAGLPRSNYPGGSFAELIQKMPQKAIDRILDRVNTHKGREHR